MLQLINTFLLQPCQVGVGCEIVYSVDAKQLIGVFVFDQIGNAVFKISQIDQDQLLIVFREEGRDRMRKAVLYHDRCAALCVVVDYFGQGVVSVNKHRILVVLLKMIVKIQRIKIRCVSALGDLT